MSVIAFEKLWGKPKDNLTVGEMKADMLLYIQSYDYVSIAELKRRYETQGTGDYAIEGPIPNVILYAGLSQVFSESLMSLVKEKLIHTHAASFLVYLIDGECLTFPIAKRPGRQGYKKTHWLPVCYRPGASCNSKECPQKEAKHGIQRKS